VITTIWIHILALSKTGLDTTDCLYRNGNSSGGIRLSHSIVEVMDDEPAYFLRCRHALDHLKANCGRILTQGIDKGQIHISVRLMPRIPALIRPQAQMALITLKSLWRKNIAQSEVTLDNLTANDNNLELNLN